MQHGIVLVVPGISALPLLVHADVIEVKGMRLRGIMSATAVHPFPRMAAEVIAK